GLVEQIKAKGLALALRGYAVPAYFPRPGIPRADVSLTASWAAAPVLAGVPIPAGARPDPESDGQMAILDRQSGCEFDLWQARRGADGRWSAAWGNTTLLAGDGTFPLGN